MRRGTAGTSPQHRTKSSIRYMDNLRISDDRALKVAEVHPGKPHASRIAGCSKLPVSGEAGHPKPLAPLGLSRLDKRRAKPRKGEENTKHRGVKATSQTE
jgi:hypothetical protein